MRRGGGREQPLPATRRASAKEQPMLLERRMYRTLTERDRSVFEAAGRQSRLS